MGLVNILDIRAVRLIAGASSKKRLFQTIAEQAELTCSVSAVQVFSALQERENLGSTGVGHGIAIPHARLEKIDRVIGLFTRLEKAVDYGAADVQKVDLVFTILAPELEGAEHLKTLALVSRTMRDPAICAKLRANDTLAILHTILTETQIVKAA